MPKGLSGSRSRVTPGLWDGLVPQGVATLDVTGKGRHLAVLYYQGGRRLATAHPAVLAVVPVGHDETGPLASFALSDAQGRPFTDAHGLAVTGKYLFAMNGTGHLIGFLLSDLQTAIGQAPANSTTFTALCATYQAPHPIDVSPGGPLAFDGTRLWAADSATSSGTTSNAPSWHGTAKDSTRGWMVGLPLTADGLPGAQTYAVKGKTFLRPDKAAFIGPDVRGVAFVQDAQRLPFVAVTRCFYRPGRCAIQFHNASRTVVQVAIPAAAAGEEVRIDEQGGVLTKDSLVEQVGVPTGAEGIAPVDDFNLAVAFSSASGEFFQTAKWLLGDNEDRLFLMRIPVLRNAAPWVTSNVVRLVIAEKAYLDQAAIPYDFAGKHSEGKQPGKGDAPQASKAASPKVPKGFWQYTQNFVIVIIPADVTIRLAGTFAVGFQFGLDLDRLAVSGSIVPSFGFTFAIEAGATLLVIRAGVGASCTIMDTQLIPTATVIFAQLPPTVCLKLEVEFIPLSVEVYVYVELKIWLRCEFCGWFCIRCWIDYCCSYHITVFSWSAPTFRFTVFELCFGPEQPALPPGEGQLQVAQTGPHTLSAQWAFQGANATDVGGSAGKSLEMHHYELCVGSTPGAADLMGCTDVGTSTSSIPNQVPLPAAYGGRNVSVTIKAFTSSGGVGNVTQSVLVSDAAPLLTGLELPRFQADPRTVTVRLPTGDPTIARCAVTLGTGPGLADIRAEVPMEAPLAPSYSWTGLELAQRQTAHAGFTCYSAYAVGQTRDLEVTLDTTPPLLELAEGPRGGNGDAAPTWFSLEPKFHGHVRRFEDDISGTDPALQLTMWAALAESGRTVPLVDTFISQSGDWVGALPPEVAKARERVTVFATVRGTNGAGLATEVTSSGQIYDLVGPEVLYVSDGQTPSGEEAPPSLDVQIDRQAVSFQLAVRDNQTGMDRLEVALAASPDPSDPTVVPVVGWTALPLEDDRLNGTSMHLVRHTFAGLQLPISIRYHVWVRATDRAGRQTVAASTGTYIDQTAPQGGHVMTGRRFTSETDHLGLAWYGFTDDYAVAGYFVGLANGTQAAPALEDMMQVGLRGSAVVQGLEMRDGCTYYAAVVALDAVGHRRTAWSEPVTVDLSPPQASPAVRILPVASGDHQLVDGRWGGPHWTQDSAQGVRAAWEACHDPQTGILEYALALGTVPMGTDVAPFTPQGGSEARQGALTQLSLRVGVSYYLTVRCTNGAGLPSYATAPDPLLVEDQLPTVRAVAFEPLADGLPHASTGAGFYQVNRTHVHIAWSADYHRAQPALTHVLVTTDRNDRFGRNLNLLLDGPADMTPVADWQPTVDGPLVASNHSWAVNRTFVLDRPLGDQPVFAIVCAASTVSQGRQACLVSALPLTADTTAPEAGMLFFGTEAAALTFLPTSRFVPLTWADVRDSQSGLDEAALLELLLQDRDHCRLQGVSNMQVVAQATLHNPQSIDTHYFLGLALADGQYGARLTVANPLVRTRLPAASTCCLGCDTGAHSCHTHTVSPRRAWQGMRTAMPARWTMVVDSQPPGPVNVTVVPISSGSTAGPQPHWMQHWDLLALWGNADGHFAGVAGYEVGLHEAPRAALGLAPPGMAQWNASTFVPSAALFFDVGLALASQLDQQAKGAAKTGHEVDGMVNPEDAPIVALQRDVELNATRCAQLGGTQCELREGLAYYPVAAAENWAGLRALVRGGPIVIDSSPPVGAAISLGSQATLWWNRTMAQWQAVACRDPESEVAFVEAGIATAGMQPNEAEPIAPGSSGPPPGQWEPEVTGWLAVPAAVGASLYHVLWDHLNLTADVEYFLHVRCTNHAGLRAAVAAPARVDETPPTLSNLGFGLRADGALHPQCVIADQLTLFWKCADEQSRVVDVWVTVGTNPAQPDRPPRTHLHPWEGSLSMGQPSMVGPQYAWVSCENEAGLVTRSPALEAIVDPNGGARAVRLQWIDPDARPARLLDCESANDTRCMQKNRTHVCFQVGLEHPAPSDCPPRAEADGAWALRTHEGQTLTEGAIPAATLAAIWASGQPEPICVPLGVLPATLGVHVAAAVPRTPYFDPVRGTSKGLTVVAQAPALLEDPDVLFEVDGLQAAVVFVMPPYTSDSPLAGVWMGLGMAPGAADIVSWTNFTDQVAAGSIHLVAIDSLANLNARAGGVINEVALFVTANLTDALGQRASRTLAAPRFLSSRRAGLVYESAGALLAAQEYLPATSDAITCSWRGFQNHAVALQRYEIALLEGSTPLHELNYTRATSYTFHNLTLTAGATYRCSVRAHFAQGAPLEAAGRGIVADGAPTLVLSYQGPPIVATARLEGSQWSFTTTGSTSSPALWWAVGSAPGQRDLMELRPLAAGPTPLLAVGPWAALFVTGCAINAAGMAACQQMPSPVFYDPEGPGVGRLVAVDEQGAETTYYMQTATRFRFALLGMHDPVAPELVRIHLGTAPGASDLGWKAVFNATLSPYDPSRAPRDAFVATWDLTADDRGLLLPGTTVWVWANVTAGISDEARVPWEGLPSRVYAATATFRILGAAPPGAPGAAWLAIPAAGIAELTWAPPQELVGLNLTLAGGFRYRLSLIDGTNGSLVASATPSAFVLSATGGGVGLLAQWRFDDAALAMAMAEGHQYHGRVALLDEAGRSSDPVDSAPLLTDWSPPTIALEIGRAGPLADSHYIGTSLTFKWKVEDAVSGIRRVAVAVGSADGLTDLLQWVEPHYDQNGTQACLPSGDCLPQWANGTYGPVVELRHLAVLWPMLTVTNGAGLSALYRGVPYLVDHTPPLPARLTVDAVVVHEVTVTARGTIQAMPDPQSRVAQVEVALALNPWNGLLTGWTPVSPAAAERGPVVWSVTFNRTALDEALPSAALARPEPCRLGVTSFYALGRSRNGVGLERIVSEGPAYADQTPPDPPQGDQAVWLGDDPALDLQCLPLRTRGDGSVGRDPTQAVLVKWLPCSDTESGIRSYTVCAMRHPSPSLLPLARRSRSKRSPPHVLDSASFLTLLSLSLSAPQVAMGVEGDPERYANWTDTPSASSAATRLALSGLERLPADERVPVLVSVRCTNGMGLNATFARQAFLNLVSPNPATAATLVASFSSETAAATVLVPPFELACPPDGVATLCLGADSQCQWQPADLCQPVALEVSPQLRVSKLAVTVPTGPAALGRRYACLTVGTKGGPDYLLTSGPLEVYTDRPLQGMVTAASGRFASAADSSTACDLQWRWGGFGDERSLAVQGYLLQVGTGPGLADLYEHRANMGSLGAPLPPHGEHQWAVRLDGNQTAGLFITVTALAPTGNASYASPAPVHCQRPPAAPFFWIEGAVALNVTAPNQTAVSEGLVYSSQRSEALPIRYAPAFVQPAPTSVTHEQYAAQQVCAPQIMMVMVMMEMLDGDGWMIIASSLVLCLFLHQAAALAASQLVTGFELRVTDRRTGAPVMPVSRLPNLRPPAPGTMAAALLSDSLPFPLQYSWAHDQQPLLDEGAAYWLCLRAMAGADDPSEWFCVGLTVDDRPPHCRPQADSPYQTATDSVTVPLAPCEPTVVPLARVLVCLGWAQSQARAPGELVPCRPLTRAEQAAGRVRFDQLRLHEGDAMAVTVLASNLLGLEGLDRAALTVDLNPPLHGEVALAGEAHPWGALAYQGSFERVHVQVAKFHDPAGLANYSVALGTAPHRADIRGWALVTDPPDAATRGSFLAPVPLPANARALLAGNATFLFATVRACNKVGLCRDVSSSLPLRLTDAPLNISLTGAAALPDEVLQAAAGWRSWAYRRPEDNATVLLQTALDRVAHGIAQDLSPTPTSPLQALQQVPAPISRIVWALANLTTGAPRANGTWEAPEGSTAAVLDFIVDRPGLLPACGWVRLDMTAVAVTGLAVTLTVPLLACPTGPAFVPPRLLPLWDEYPVTVPAGPSSSNDNRGNNVPTASSPDVLDFVWLPWWRALEGNLTQYENLTMLDASLLNLTVCPDSLPHCVNASVLDQFANRTSVNGTVALTRPQVFIEPILLIEPTGPSRPASPLSMPPTKCPRLFRHSISCLIVHSISPSHHAFHLHVPRLTHPCDNSRPPADCVPTHHNQSTGAEAWDPYEGLPPPGFGDGADNVTGPPLPPMAPAALWAWDPEPNAIPLVRPGHRPLPGPLAIALRAIATWPPPPFFSPGLPNATWPPPFLSPRRHPPGHPAHPSSPTRSAPAWRLCEQGLMWMGLLEQHPSSLADRGVGPGSYLTYEALLADGANLTRAGDRLLGCLRRASGQIASRQALAGRIGAAGGWLPGGSARVYSENATLRLAATCLADQGTEFTAPLPLRELPLSSQAARAALAAPQRPLFWSHLSGDVTPQPYRYYRALVGLANVLGSVSWRLSGGMLAMPDGVRASPVANGTLLLSQHSRAPGAAPWILNTTAGLEDTCLNITACLHETRLPNATALELDAMHLHLDGLLVGGDGYLYYGRPAVTALIRVAGTLEHLSDEWQGPRFRYLSKWAGAAPTPTDIGAIAGPAGRAPFLCQGADADGQHPNVSVVRPGGSPLLRVEMGIGLNTSLPGLVPWVDVTPRLGLSACPGVEPDGLVAVNVSLLALPETLRPVYVLVRLVDRAQHALQLSSEPFLYDPLRPVQGAVAIARLGPDPVANDTQFHDQQWVAGPPSPLCVSWGGWESAHSGLAAVAWAAVEMAGVAPADAAREAQLRASLPALFEAPVNATIDGFTLRSPWLPGSGLVQGAGCHNVSWNHNTTLFGVVRALSNAGLESFNYTSASPARVDQLPPSTAAPAWVHAGTSSTFDMLVLVGPPGHLTGPSPPDVLFPDPPTGHALQDRQLNDTVFILSWGDWAAPLSGTKEYQYSLWERLDGDPAASDRHLFQEWTRFGVSQGAPFVASTNRTDGWPHELLPGATYYGCVRAVSVVASGPLCSGGTRLGAVSVQVDPAQGATFPMEDPGNPQPVQGVVTVPPGATSSAVHITCTSSQSSVPPQEIGCLGDTFQYGSYAFTMKVAGQESFAFGAPVTVTLVAESLKSQAFRTPILLYFRPDGSYLDAATTCTPPSVPVFDRAAGTFKVRICHLTTFALILSKAQLTIADRTRAYDPEQCSLLPALANGTALTTSPAEGVTQTETLTLFPADPALPLQCARIERRQVVLQTPFGVPAGGEALEEHTIRDTLPPDYLTDLPAEVAVNCTRDFAGSFDPARLRSLLGMNISLTDCQQQYANGTRHTVDVIPDPSSMNGAIDLRTVAALSPTQLRCGLRYAIRTVAADQCGNERLRVRPLTIGPGPQGTPGLVQTIAGAVQAGFWGLAGVGAAVGYGVHKLVQRRRRRGPRIPMVVELQEISRDHDHDHDHHKDKETPRGPMEQGTDRGAASGSADAGSGVPAVEEVAAPPSVLLPSPAPPTDPASPAPGPAPTLVPEPIEVLLTPGDAEVFNPDGLIVCEDFLTCADFVTVPEDELIRLSFLRREWAVNLCSTIDDAGWGCAYRCGQTMLSTYNLAHPPHDAFIPDIPEMQAQAEYLINPDQPTEHVVPAGHPKAWFDPVLVGAWLRNANRSAMHPSISLDATVLEVPLAQRGRTPNVDAPDPDRDIIMQCLGKYFRGAPDGGANVVMVDNGVQAFVLAGMSGLRPSAHDLDPPRVLIMDPHTWTPEHIEKANPDCKVRSEECRVFFRTFMNGCRQGADFAHDDNPKWWACALEAPIGWKAL
ncbi:hypothetical protein PAPYR_1470 [Paratrimastix pyriformis]|uniref:Uncharacterized protein n=1 Tax=Paratrimastix pyriformis TaxID=342808 RepID=A0ABQ8UTF9_9EUKA|nr:hypothetical protein PAPYR_1470 [Paratrimastix pyriformis]